MNHIVTGKPSVVVTYSYVCSVVGCGVVRDEKYDAWPGYEMASPCAPAGWRQFFGSLFCPKHKVELVIDSNEDKRVTI